MPRSVAEILAHADELASKFEAFEPATKDRGKGAESLATLRAAARSRGAAERAVAAAVAEARSDGQSWSAVGAMLGTSGEAARQRYRDAEPKRSMAASSSDVNAQKLVDAGFTADELRDFAGLLEFASVLGTAGHVGPVGDVQWTPDKAKALFEVLREFGGTTEPPPGYQGGPEIRVHAASGPSEDRDDRDAEEIECS